MPTYDFKCRKCDLVFEKLVHSAITLVPCDKCSDSGADRQLSCPASIKMADMATVNRKRDRIREPVLRDVETGKVTSFY
jgi:putative FmdB family regulatory protein